MEINPSNTIQSASPTSNNNSTGVTAPQTDAQRADVNATRVVSPKETVRLEDKASGAEEHRFEAIRSKAAKFTGGDNAFLSDVKFTIYGAAQTQSGLNEYYIRFTDLGTGAVDVKTESELFASTSGGDLVSGQI